MPRPKPEVPRKNRLNINLSGEELDYVNALARVSGLSTADYIRQFIRSEAARMKMDHDGTKVIFNFAETLAVLEGGKR